MTRSHKTGILLAVLAALVIVVIVVSIVLAALILLRTVIALILILVLLALLIGAFLLSVLRRGRLLNLLASAALLTDVLGNDIIESGILVLGKIDRAAATGIDNAGCRLGAYGYDLTLALGTS